VGFSQTADKASQVPGFTARCGFVYRHGYVRKAYGLKSRFDRLRERGLLTITEMAKVCGVSINTIGHWRKKGLIGAHPINDRAQFLFEGPERNPPKKHSRKASTKAA